MKTVTARTEGGICKIDNLRGFEYLLGIRIPPYRFVGSAQSIYPLCCSLRCRDWVKHFWILDPSREFVSFADPEPLFVNWEFEPVWLEFRSIGSPDCQLLELSVELLVRTIIGDDARFALLTQHKDKPVNYAQLGFHRKCFEEVPVLPALSPSAAIAEPPAAGSEKNSNL